MRLSTFYLIFTGLCIMALCVLLIVHPQIRSQALLPAQNERAQMVRDLQLTDLCLFTEARYTRHLSQADLGSAFQDHPMGLEHFPSGSMVRPPARLWRNQNEMD